MFIIGIDPHKGSHTAVAIDGDERLVGELLGARRSPTTRATVALGGGVRTATVGRRGRDRSRRVVGAAARRRGRDGAGCAGSAFGEGAAVGLGPQGQDRSIRRPLGRDRRVTEPEPAFGRARGSSSDLAAVRTTTPSAHRGADPCDLSAARGVVRDDRRRPVEESLGETGRFGASQAPSDRRDRDRTETDRGRVPRRGPSPRPRARSSSAIASRAQSPRRARRSPTCTASARSSPRI